MLIENDFFRGQINKVQTAIDRLQNFVPKEGYYLAFSGGKDSVVIKALANIAGTRYDAHYNLTTIDPPELVWFIKKNHPDVVINKPAIPFLKRLPVKGFPLRQNRWCCEEYKEKGGQNRVVITGIRWAESSNRKNRRMTESCYKDGTKIYLHPIIDWSDSDVWEFIRKYKILYCKLYDEGFKRLGCLFCPFSPNRKKQAKRWSKYAQAFERAFIKLHENRKREAKEKKKECSVNRWANGKEMFQWWLMSKPPKHAKDQMVLFE